MPEISAVAGETLYVACPVAGYPIDNVKWYRGKRFWSKTKNIKIVIFKLISKEINVERNCFTFTTKSLLVGC